MNTTNVGNEAETAAVNYLQSQKFKIIDRNWRIPSCEIDIVAQKDKAVFFVEVKYRKTSSFGGGFDYIGPKKLQKMQYAAQAWVQSRNWKGNYQLAAIEVTGSNFEVTGFVEC